MEKHQPPMAEDFHQSDTSSTESTNTVAIAETNVPCYSPKETKRLVRKIDRKLLPLLCLLYLLSFLDRTNIGNAKLASLETDLNMTGKYDYNIAIAIFYPFYVAVEIPSNLALKKFKPSVWIPSIMVTWGALSLTMGTVKSFTGLLAVRAALGLAEGGLFPGITYYISLWYLRQECGFRIAIFFSAATLAGAFGGLLARGIMEMSGLGGLGGWSWIFIIEGSATILVAIMAYFVMHDFPSTAKFLTTSEKGEVIRRLEQDQSVLSEEFKWQFVIDALKDWKIHIQMVIFFGIFTSVYSVSIFLPTIIKGLGYTNEIAQLLSAPPYIVACICTLLTGYWSDKNGHRGGYIMVACTIAVLGFALLASVQNHGVKYFACFLVTMGTYPNVALSMAWTSNNIGGSVKRGVGIAMVGGFGNLGGIMSSFMFRNDEAPRYISGYASLLGISALSGLCSLFMVWYCQRENARRDREYPKEYTLEKKMQESDKGDNATFFRYIL